MEEKQLMTAVFGSLSIVGMLLVCLFNYFQNSRTQRRYFSSLNKTMMTSRSLENLHFFFCLLFVFSTIVMMVEINDEKKNKLVGASLELLYQYLICTEMVFILFENVLNDVGCSRLKMSRTRRNIALLALLSIPLLPVIAAFTDVLVKLSTSANARQETSTPHEIIHTEPTTAFSVLSRTELTADISHKTSKEATEDSSNAIMNNQSIDTRRVHIDPLLLIRPQFAMISSFKNLSIVEETTIESFTTDKYSSAQPPVQSRQESKQVNLSVSSFCITTWGSVSAACSLAYMLVLLTGNFAFGIVKFNRLRRNERRGEIVALEEWFCLICRLYLGLATFLKWLALIFYCHSSLNIYSVYVMILSTPPMLFVITNHSRTSSRSRYKFGKLKRICLSRYKERTSSNCFLTNDQLESNETSFSDVMHQIQGPVCGHVTSNVADREFDNFLQSQFEGFAEESFGKENFRDSVGDELPANAASDDIIKRNNNVLISPSKADLVPPIPSKNASNGETRTSVFDDSDYDEVIDFMMSLTVDSTAVSEQSSDVKSNLKDDNNLASTDDVGSSKRSSASSVSTTSSSTSGVESGEDRSAVSKYANLDIAKILHTKKRIHRILQSPPENQNKQESQANDIQPGQNQSAKKKSYLSKRYTHYGTLGSRNKSGSSLRFSRPPSSGVDDAIANQFFPDSTSSNSGSSFRRQTKAGHYANEWESKRSTDGEETNRLSRISVSSFSSDRGPPSPHKGGWKPWKKLVNNNNTTKPPNHDAIKATIHLSPNSNWNNNSSSLSDSSSHHLGLTKSSPKLALSSSEVRLSGTSPGPQTKDPAPKRFTNSLKRRFSRKSSSRSRNNTRRRSLPAENVLGVNPTSGDLSYLPDPIRIKSSPKDPEACDEIESMVLTSVHNRHEEEEKNKSPEKPRKSSSIRKRLFSFTRKRNSSLERKTILKQSSNSCEDNQGKKLNKSLSCSSPQLSVFAVNSLKTSEQIF